MIEPSRLQEILLYDLSILESHIFSLLKVEALELLPAVILISSFIAFIFGMDFGGVLRRAFLAVAAILLFHWFFIECAQIGMDVGNSFLSKDNFLLKSISDARISQSMGNAKKDKTASEVWKEAGSIDYSKKQIEELRKNAGGFFGNWGKDALGFLVWILSNFALWFVKVSFSIAFYMPLITIPIVALVNIIPFTSKALDGALFSSIWIMVTPIVVTILLELINGMLVADNVMASASILSKSLMSIFFALYIVSSFTLSSKMLGQTGISEGISQIGQSFGSGMVSGAVMWGLSKTKGLGKGLVWGKGGNHSPLRKVTLNPINNQRSKLYQRAQNIHIGNSQTAAENLAGVKPGFSAKENKILKLNSIANPIKAIRDKRDRSIASKEAVKNGEPLKEINLNATNQMREEKGKQLISSKGHAYGDKDKVSANDWSREKSIEKEKMERIIQTKEEFRSRKKEINEIYSTAQSGHGSIGNKSLEGVSQYLNMDLIGEFKEIKKDKEPIRKVGNKQKDINHGV